MSPNHFVADISSNNLSFDAAQYAAAGHVLVGIKATEDTGYVNPNHTTWTLHAHSCHVGVLHYHFARPDLNTEPTAEARHFLSVALRNAGGRDYLVLDLERATPQGWTHDPAWSAAFDEYVQINSRFHTILYASRATLGQSDAWLTGDNRRVWEADWSGQRGWAPKGYALALRQFTDGVFGSEPHSLPGVGVCDVSYMSTDLFRAALRERPHPC